MTDLLMRRSAIISPCTRYRYWLEREWDRRKPVLSVCMLNPSSADDKREDPTLLALIHFATLWGYGGLAIVNLYAWRSPTPALMKTKPERMGPNNALHRREAMLMGAIHSGSMLVAWGNDGNWEGEAEQFAAWATEQIGVDLVCLGTTLSGAPKHPMARGKYRIPRDQQPVMWRPAV